MAEGIHTDKHGNQVHVRHTSDGHYMLTYTNGRVVFI